MGEAAQSNLASLEERIEKLEKGNQDRLCLFVFSGDWDKIFSSFVLATGSAAAGTEVVMFFTFWGVSAIRKKAPAKKNILEKMFGFLLPQNISSLTLSKFNFAGIGPFLMNIMVKQKNVSNLEEMRSLAEDLGVQIRVCDMSVNILGISREEIIDYEHLTHCGVQEFLRDAADGRLTLYI